MQQPDALVTTPGIDLPSYIQHIIDFFYNNYPQLFFGAKETFGIIIGVCIILIVLLLILIIYCVEGIKRIRNKEKEIYEAHVDMAYEDVPKGDSNLAKRWDTVLNHLESENQNDWKQAIIEADVILDSLLTKLGYQGEGIGEKLKRANKGDFKTLDQAGEAHGVRNRIAHDGIGFILSHHEARRVINLYREVFEEFFYI